MEKINTFINQRINESAGEVKGADITKDFILVEYTNIEQSNPCMHLFINPECQGFMKFVKEVAKSKAKATKINNLGNLKTVLLAPLLQKTGMDIAKKYPGEYVEISFDVDPDCPNYEYINISDLVFYPKQSIEKRDKLNNWSTSNSYDYISWDDVRKRYTEFMKSEPVRKHLEKIL